MPGLTRHGCRKTRPGCSAAPPQPRSSVVQVVHRLPEQGTPRARAVADALLAQEVGALAASPGLLVQAPYEDLLAGKLALVRALVLALDRLGVGLGQGGRPGLVGILTSR